MTSWQFILIALILMNGSVPRAASIAQFRRNNLERRYGRPVYNEGRLSNDVVPRRYVIAIFPDFRNDKFHGAIRIDVRIPKARNYIVLHAKDLAIKTAALYSRRSRGEIPTKFAVLEDKYEIMIIEAEEIIPPGDYFLRMNFSGNLAGKISGFYLSTYSDVNGTVRKLAITQFEPTYARSTFPCFDEPRFKSIFHMRLVHLAGSNYHALSNMPITKVRKLTTATTATTYTNTSITFFAPTPPMPTYLVAFAVGEFECHGDTMHLRNGSEVPLNVCSRSAYKNKTRFALNLAVRTMEYFSTIFTSDYPLPKLDLLAVPDFAAGAMENWGLITFRETEILQSRDHSSCGDTRRVSSTVAHELAHMWFGDLVTMGWWNDLWLNEGFATYMEHVAVDYIFPDWKQMDSFPLFTKYLAMRYDKKWNVQPIIRTIEDNEGIGEMFDHISYQKAAGVIRMLEDAVGNFKFVYGIRNYLGRYQFRNAESRELFEILRNSTRGTIDIVEFMDRWTKLPGFPLVNVRQDSTVFRLSQQRFLHNKKFHGANVGGSWDIPLKYVTSRTKENAKFDWFLANFSCVELSVEGAVEWIKLNHDSVGYYIVNYTEEAWNTFGSLLSRNHRALNPTDRADLLHDAFLLADSADLCYCLAMNLSSYLVNETAYQPWVVASEWLLRTNRLLESTRSHVPFQSYARSLIEGIYRRVGWNVEARESFIDRELRVLILSTACGIRHEDCLEIAAKKLRVFLKNDDDARRLPTDIRSIVYSFGAATQSGNLDVIFENMSRIFAREVDAQEKERLMIGLASIQDVDVLDRYLRKAIDGNFIRRQDFSQLLIKVASNPIGLDVAWNFIRSNWGTLSGKYGLNDYGMGTAISRIVSFFKDEEKLKEATDFFAERFEGNVGENAKKSAIEEIENNVSWLDANFRKIDRWLRDNGFN